MLALADADAILRGTQAYEQAGISVAPAGDVNGDGRPDLLLGAPNADVDGEDDGVAYLLLGGAERLAGDVPLPERATRLVSREAGARLGGRWRRSETSTATGSTTSRSAPPPPPYSRGVGDVSGDGLDDLVIGAVEAEHEGVRTGRVSLVAGRAEPGSRIDLAAEGRYRFETIVPGKYAGLARHIHFALSAPGYQGLITQWQIDDDEEPAAELEFDFVLSPV